MLNWEQISRKSILFCVCDKGGENLLFDLIRHRSLKGEIVSPNDLESNGDWPREMLRQVDFSKKILSRYDLIISGTGAGNFEKEIFLSAMSSNVPSIHFLDHWSRYRERFTIMGTFFPPESIVAFDTFSHELAGQTFPYSKIFLERNHYADRMIKLARLSEVTEYEWLLIDEPSPFFDEIDNLGMLLKKLIKENKFKVIYRPHPSRKSDFLKLVESLKVEISDEQNIGVDIGRAKKVLGLTSFGIYIAYLAGKPIFSVSPNETLKLLPVQKVNSI